MNEDEWVNQLRRDALKYTLEWGRFTIVHGTFGFIVYFWFETDEDVLIYQLIKYTKSYEKIADYKPYLCRKKL